MVYLCYLCLFYVFWCPIWFTYKIMCLSF